MKRAFGSVVRAVAAMPLRTGCCTSRPRLGHTAGTDARPGTGRRSSSPTTPPGPPPAGRRPSTPTTTARVVVLAWNPLHPALTHRAGWEDQVGELPIVEGTVIRLEVDHLPGERTPKPLWLWSSATSATADLPPVQADPRLDRAPAPRPARGRPLELGRHRRLHPAQTRPRPYRRPPPPLGKTRTTRQAHPRPCPMRVPPPPPPTAEAGSRTETREARPRTPTRLQETTPRTPPPRGQTTQNECPTEHRKGPSTLNVKLSGAQGNSRMSPMRSHRPPRQSDLTPIRCRPLRSQYRPYNMRASRTSQGSLYNLPHP
jgi:hypothetical protein